MKIEFTKLEDDQINTLVEPEKEGYHVFWWFKTMSFVEQYVKYNVYFDGEDYGTSTIPNGKCEKDVIEEVTKGIEDGMYDY